MKSKAILATFGLAGLLAVGATAEAHDDEPHNLKVLQDNGKALEKGMKDLSKGLGVKCNACHVKGKFGADDVPAKEVARTFLQAAMGEKDQAKRDAALAPLLKALKLDKAKKPELVWTGIGKFAKKK